MRIGQVAIEAGVPIDTLRYYERRGLLEEPDRKPSGYREYSPDAVRLIRFIKRAQDLGFTLDEIEELARFRGTKAGSRAKTRSLAEAKVRAIDEKIRRLRAIRDALGVLLTWCECSRGRPECPILEALDDPKPLTQIRKGPKEPRNGKH